MKKMIIVSIFLIAGILLFAACHADTSGPAPAPVPNTPASAGGGSAASGSGGGSAQNNGSIPSAPVKGDSPIGTWYEQMESGGVLEVTDKKISYTWSGADNSSYTQESSLTIVRQGNEYLLQTKEEDFFSYVDIVYKQDEDIIEAHTMPVLDGDGGYKLRTFARTSYVAPPPPVYDPPTDNSDADAQKVFKDMTIRSMRVSFYDEGAYHDPSSSMAPMEPYADEYSYDLTVQEDGSALVSSSFCREIEIPRETVEELQQLIRESDLGQLNGIDIHTEGMPYGTASYELELDLASGEKIRSSANGPDVPAEWRAFQAPMHYLLYFAFRNAGYNYGSFHSTRPMKRLGTGTPPKIIDWRKMLEAAPTGYYYRDDEDENAGKAAENAALPEPVTVKINSVRVEPDWQKAYDYSLHTEYLVFEDITPANPAVMRTLEKLNQEYKAAAETSLQEDYAMMQQVASSVWKRADLRYCYSFYTAANQQDHGTFWSVLISEGHANSLGAGKYGYGYYPYTRYNIDTKTGQVLSAADLFTDQETAVRYIVEKMRSEWGTHNKEGQFIHSDEFPKKLEEFIGKTGRDSISCNAYYDYLELYFPTAMFTMAESSVREVLYYDEIQDILSDTYTTVW